MCLPAETACGLFLLRAWRRCAYRKCQRKALDGQLYCKDHTCTAKDSYTQIPCTEKKTSGLLCKVHRSEQNKRQQEEANRVANEIKAANKEAADKIKREKARKIIVQGADWSFEIKKFNPELTEENAQAMGFNTNTTMAGGQAHRYPDTTALSSVCWWLVHVLCTCEGLCRSYVALAASLSALYNLCGCTA